MKLGKIEWKRYGLSDEQYQEIYELLQNSYHSAITEKYKLSYSKTHQIVNQIHNIVAHKKKELHIILEQQPEYKTTSWKELLFPIDNGATIGNVVIKNNRLIQDGIDITNNYL
jgi:hypothetical protein